MVGVLLSLASCNKSEEKKIWVKVSPLPLKDAKALFLGRGRLLVKGPDALIPLRITVHNNGPESVTVSPVMMAVTDSEYLYKRIEKSVAGIATMSTVGGLLLAGPIGAAAFGSGFGIANAKKNDAMLRELNETILVQPEEVRANNALDKIMFIRKSDYSPEFSLSIGSESHSINLA